jgi:flagellar basal body rod protein FlgB
VAFDPELERARLAMSSLDGAQRPPATPQVVATGDGVRLDEEMALMARNALQYQLLLGAFDGQMGLLRLAIREGRGS